MREQLREREKYRWAGEKNIEKEGKEVIGKEKEREKEREWWGEILSRKK